MALTRENWTITAALLQFPGTTPDGFDVTSAGPSVWRPVLDDVFDAGFDAADLTDSWLRPGDMTGSQLADFAQLADDVGLRTPVVSVVRRSVIDPVSGVQNLAYAHRTIDAAAALGVRVVCLGLHRPLTRAQRDALWFWTEPGAQDPLDDREIWELAISRFRELGKHAAEVGVLLSLEMYEDTYLGTASSAVALIEGIGLPNVGLNPDVGNIVRLHRPIERWQDMLRATLPYTNYWHVKNYLRDESPDSSSYVTMPIALEAGVISYREAFRWALSAGFQGIICTEHYGGDGLSVSATNRDYLRRHVLPKTADYALGASKVDQVGHHTSAPVVTT